MMQPHPLSELLPAMSTEALAQLADDIKAHGLHQPITLYEGKILDGRHRHQACAIAQVAPRFDNFTGDESSAVAFVASQNLARRQLTKSQLAMAGAKLKAWHAERAKERQVAAAAKGNQTKHGKSSVQANLPEPKNEQARDAAAKTVGVSGRMVDDAENIMKKAAPAIVNMVQSGAMTVNEASNIAELSKDVQQRLASAPTKAIRVIQYREAKNRSQAARERSDRVAPSNVVQAADAPGTPLVRTLLSRLELLTNEIERTKLTQQQFAERFLSEFDWTEPLLVRRLSYVDTAVQMMATLSVMSQRAKRQAA